MNKWTSALIGAVTGLATGAVYLYLFAPARGTTFDENYQSRLDWALAEGKKAGDERQRELIDELQQARISPPEYPKADNASDLSSGSEKAETPSAVETHSDDTGTSEEDQSGQSR